MWCMEESDLGLSNNFCLAPRSAMLYVPFNTFHLLCGTYVH